MANFPEQYRSEARLLILRGLAEEGDGTLSSKLIGRKLQTYGINRDRDWIHQEIRWLAHLGAVTVVDADSVLVATITGRGRTHLARQFRLEGVDWPSEAIITE